MSYKTNYELYSRGSIDSRRSPPPDELLSPLATLYPHVAALQPQYNPSNCTFTGYRDTGYWAAAYTTQTIDDSSMSMRRIDGRPRRFVSKLRRLLSRDDLKHRRGSRATARTA
ncbi:hypothetical protein N7449_008888 [Penicillium cf. viridicatum]|uniref:Uncharacterized protein n=1 Tax=Penicillium cf. viridicatum TaxID=2972119 RepID=A0A9W9M7K3_9EURO|nr:hypothetical protein N7449_008888 [Penicillium cf. viridicatum]